LDQSGGRALNNVGGRRRRPYNRRQQCDEGCEDHPDQQVLCTDSIGTHPDFSY
jgi:hypothetical protein